jgi:hypothetical protein
MGFSSMIKAPMGQLIASGAIQPVAKAVGSSPSGAVQGGGLSMTSGLLSLLNDPAIRAKLNLSTPAAQEVATAATAAPAAPSLSMNQQNFMNTDAYKQAYSNYLQSLAPNSSPVTPKGVSYIDIYDEMSRDSANLRPFKRR